MAILEELCNNINGIADAQIPSLDRPSIASCAGQYRKLLATGVVVLVFACLCRTLGRRRWSLKSNLSDDAAVSREYQVKAAYLYQFGRYVQWPQTAFAGPR